MSAPRWQLRETLPELADRYRREDLWNDSTLGQFLAGCMAAEPQLRLRVWSKTRPFEASMGRMHEIARRVAGGFRARGVEPGDVVAFQLPNWMEAAVVFLTETFR